jgi:hypothetical protein
VKEAVFLTGPALNKLLDKMGKVLVGCSPLPLTTGLTCSFEERIEAANDDG